MLAVSLAFISGELLLFLTLNQSDFDCVACVVAWLRQRNYEGDFRKECSISLTRRD